MFNGSMFLRVNDIGQLNDLEEKYDYKLDFITFKTGIHRILCCILSIKHYRA